MSECEYNRGRSQAAGIGCGSVIIIAFIVVIFGRANLKPMEAEIADLRAEVARLQEAQTHANALLETVVMHLDVEPGNGEPAAPKD